jgi:hypothetical protein
MLRVHANHDVTGLLPQQGPRLVIGLGQAMLGPVFRTGAIDGWPRSLAVGADRFFGKSANWIPLSVSTISTDIRRMTATDAETTSVATL